MATVIDLDDVVMQNAFDVQLIKRGQDAYSSDTYIPGDKAAQTIRAYFYMSGQKYRTFGVHGELTDQNITMWVSDRWLVKNSIEISLDDMILHDGIYYEIIEQDVLQYHSKINVYVLKKEISITDHNPLPSTRPPPVILDATIEETTYDDFFNNQNFDIRCDGFMDYFCLQTDTMEAERFVTLLENWDDFDDDDMTQIVVDQDYKFIVRDVPFPNILVKYFRLEELFPPSVFNIMESSKADFADSIFDHTNYFKREDPPTSHIYLDRDLPPISLPKIYDTTNLTLPKKEEDYIRLFLLSESTSDEFSSNEFTNTYYALVGGRGSFIALDGGDFIYSAFSYESTSDDFSDNEFTNTYYSKYSGTGGFLALDSNT